MKYDTWDHVCDFPMKEPNVLIGHYVTQMFRFADLMRSDKARTIGPCKHFLPHHPTPPPNISHAFDVLLSSLYPSCFFSIFDMDKLVKNHQYNWEECFKIRKLSCLNVICGTKI